MASDEPPAKKRRLSNDTQDATDSSLTLGSADWPATAKDVSGVSEPASAKQAAETQSAVKAVPLDEDGKPLSKNQQKKLKRKLEWAAQKGERKVLRKEKLTAKRERKKAAREANPEAFEVKHERIIHKQLPVTILIDCDFDNLMHDGERTSLASQITRSYSDNKNAPFRAHLTISSFGGRLKERYETTLSNHHKNWRGVRFIETDFVEAAERAKAWMAGEEGGELAGAFSKYAESDLDKLKAEGEVVYLSAESDETLQELKPFSTYIIGGLVDKNREKGLCHRRATQRGIKTARLPIGDFLEMSSRKVLTTNHVNEIMMKWLETNDWAKAFISVIPKRKGGQLKGTVDEDEDEDVDVDIDVDADADNADITADQQQNLTATQQHDPIADDANPTQT